MTVLDASAFLAFLFHEPGWDLVAARIGSSCISAVNLSEVIGKFVARGVSAELVMDRIRASTVEVVSFSATGAELAASLIPLSRSLGLSLADRACLALAIARDLPVLTADRAWATLDIGVSVHLIR